jgi:hypothetical protein
VLEHGFIRLRRNRAKTPCLQAPAQHLPQLLGSAEALPQQVTLPPGLCQFGVEPPSAGQPGHDVAKEESEAGHYGDNSLAVPLSREGCIATLWHLTWNDDRVRCAVYQNAEGMQLRLESDAGVIVSEPFDMQPRAFARSRALRESLKRRGWREV